MPRRTGPEGRGGGHRSEARNQTSAPCSPPMGCDDSTPTSPNGPPTTTTSHGARLSPSPAGRPPRGRCPVTDADNAPRDAAASGDRLVRVASRNRSDVRELAADLGIPPDFGHSQLVGRLRHEVSAGFVSHHRGRISRTAAGHEKVEGDTTASQSPHHANLRGEHTPSEASLNPT
jgi:hypothetical protein